MKFRYLPSRSTERRAKSGLGLERQRKAVLDSRQRARADGRRNFVEGRKAARRMTAAVARRLAEAQADRRVF